MTASSRERMYHLEKKWLEIERSPEMLMRIPSKVQPQVRLLLLLWQAYTDLDRSAFSA